jgi:high affinity choline transporter 7
MCSSRPPPLPTGGRYLLADRNIGWIIGTLSMLAIKTGGVLPNAIAETTFRQGLLWCQLPLAAGCSVVVGGLLFARAMYSEGFLTVVDPFQVSIRACAAHMYVLQHVYGPRIGAFLFVPILIADLLYSCVIITSLAQLQTMVLGFDPWVAIVGSTVALLCYLLIGGFYAGTFTDSLQYIYLLIGLVRARLCTRTHTPHMYS